MRVLHIAPSFYPAVSHGGPMIALYGLCNALAGQGIQIRVLTTDDAGAGKRLPVKDFPTVTPAGYPVFYCRRNYLTSVSASFLWRLAGEIRWSDAVHLTAVYSFPTIPTLFLCRLLKKPVIWSPRGSLQRWQGTTWPRLKSLWEEICRLVRPKQLVLHVTSDEEAQESREKFPNTETVVIPNGIELPRKAIPVSNSQRLRLLYLGRLHPKKGIENLLEALTHLNGSLNRPWSLKLAGTGEARYTESIKMRIRQLELSRQVEMPGEISEGQKPKLFRETDVVIVPSHTENFGMVVAESLAHGVPVIASTGTPWRRIEEVGCGLWVENTPRSLAHAIGRMSRMPLQEMGKQGREWMKREFSWDERAREMGGLYSSLIK